MQSDLKNIKKKYSESFAHLCRELFPTLLETEGLLYSLIESNFYHSKFLYSDIVNNNLKADFQRFINSLVDTKEEIEINTNKTPKELLDSVGYTLYECKTEEDIQRFKKYYAKGEKLCTFRDGRLNSCYVFFAVKKNVADIKREKFTNPQRQDEYGTSVISIQFTKYAQSTVSIKNRYNHTVNNPDSTFSNNLENIVCGLTRSFEITYDLDIKKPNQQNFEIPGYVHASNGKFYKYNYEINNVYYCPDNIIIDNFEIKKYEKDRYIVFDYFILDMAEKAISLYDNKIKDSFPKYNKNLEKVEIRKEKDKKYILLKKENNQMIIVLDNKNKMVSYYNNLISSIGDNFLKYNRYLEAIYLDRVKQIGNYFMENNRNLKYIQIPLLEKCGDYFLNKNKKLEEISFLNLEYIGNKFIYWNGTINKVNLPMVKEIGNDFMSQNRQLKYLELSSLIKTGNGFICRNRIINFFYAPYLEEVGSEFLAYNNFLTYLELPNLKSFGYQFLRYNEVLKELRLPCLKEIGEYYLEQNNKLDTLEIPEVISNRFIYSSSFKNNFKTNQKRLKYNI